MTLLMFLEDESYLDCRCLTSSYVVTLLGLVPDFLVLGEDSTNKTEVQESSKRGRGVRDCWK